MALSPKTLRVSIGLAVYNGERFLPKTLDSLLAQTYRDFELIVCDNCSADRTEQICRSYSERDARIRYHRNAANIGAPRNFNLAFSLSRGEYFKWAGGDDLCAPEMLERCVAVLDQRPEAVLVYSKTRLIDENDATVKDYDDRLDLPFASPHNRLSHLLWNIRMCNAVFGLIRSRVMKRVGLFGTYPNSDLAFLAALALQGTFVEIPERLFLRRFHGLSVQRYPSAHERVAMFDPPRAGQLTFPNWKLLAAHLLAIHRSPSNWTEKLRCYFKMHIWLRRRGGDLGIDLQVAARHLLRWPTKRRLPAKVEANSGGSVIAKQDNNAISTKQ